MNNTTTNMLPGIPFDANKPEDLARLKAGWPLVQRDGTKFEGKFLCIAESHAPFCQLIFLEAGYTRSFSKSGYYASFQCEKDLFFASNKIRKSKWVAVVKDDNSKEYIATQDTKEELEQLIAKLCDTILSGPTELSWEEDAPLPPVEQPKAGWYVGPFKSGERAYQAAIEVNANAAYGTLEEVKL
jgi:hypothetical protein